AVTAVALGRLGTTAAARSNPQAAIPPIHGSARVAVKLFQLGAGVLGMVGLTALLLWVLPAPVVPPGWMLIRPPHEVSALALQGDVVWAGGEDGLVAIDRLTGRLQTLPPGAPRLRAVKDLLVDRAGVLWIAHGHGLTRFTAGQWHT